MKLLPYKFKILGEVFVLLGLVSLLVLVFAFSMDISTPVFQLVMSLFVILCYLGIAVIIFSKERIENESVMRLRFKSLVIVVLLYFIAFIALDIYGIWAPGRGRDSYLSLIHTVPFVYYLLFRIFYRSVK